MMKHHAKKHLPKQRVEIYMNNASLLETLRDPATIRYKSQLIYQKVLDNQSPYFNLNQIKLKSCTDYLIDLIQKDYPDLKVPFHSRWRHFEVGGIDRVAQLKGHPQFPHDSIAQSRCFIELTIISVLLDAGAGNQWQYHEKDTEQYHARSEGLAIASLDMYQSGVFSSEDCPFSVNADALSSLSIDNLAQHFQLSNSNPLEGVEGRVSLLHQLASVLNSHPDIFKPDARLGNLFDFLLSLSAEGTLDAAIVLKQVLFLFSPIWPSRLSLDDHNMGDVWCYSSIPADNEKSNWIPFHKLSQWLTYSLLEPFMWHGIKITGLDKLTGLPEYRNGGFFIDMGVIQIKDQDLLDKPYPPEHDAIIEWRALTIILLDQLWDEVCQQMHFSKSDFPLVKLLEAGTWKAGRIEARKHRQNGAPPIQIISDGTVF